MNWIEKMEQEGKLREKKGRLGMEIRKFSNEYISQVVALWNVHLCGCTQYKPLTEAGFVSKFIGNANFSCDGTFVAIEGEKTVGFANGIVKKEFLPGETAGNTPGYPTMIIVDPEYRGKGIGSLLLSRLEQFFKTNGKTKSQSIFFNPVKLEWYIPGTDRHEHNNSPGVDAETPALDFMKKNGYLAQAEQVSYHLDLAGFHMSPATVARQAELLQKGIYTGYYNPKEHFGFEELFDDLGNGDWKKGILDNISKEAPDPVIVAADHGKICGFTGPIRAEESGRGFFVGIGTHSQYRGGGIMTVLFELLMEGFKTAGARYSTLFTGTTNPARKIYQRTGFQIARYWSVMGKEL